MSAKNILIWIIATCFHNSLQQGDSAGGYLRRSCNDGAGICIPYYFCRNGTIDSDAYEVLNLRIEDSSDCANFFEKCCAEQNVVGQVTPPQPPQPPQPTLNETSQYELRPCGFRNPGGVGTRISVGDKDGDTEFGEFSWMVQLYVAKEILGERYSLYQCGGSIIHERVVLSAAHCVHGKDKSALIIRAGEWDTGHSFEIYAHSHHAVQEVVIHDGFYKAGLHNDIALLFLSDSVTFSWNINPICLPPQDANFDNIECTVSGWGKNALGDQGKYQNVLKKADLSVVPTVTCQEVMSAKRVNVHESMLCAGGQQGQAACKGDGGSPLVCPIEDRPGYYYQSGIVAAGIDCGESSTPGLYVDVAKFRNWIDQQMSSRGLQTQSYTLQLS